MNRTISAVFRAIPLLMGAVCLSHGLYILAGPDDANHFVAGHVNIGLTAICYALFPAAATIIRQFIDRYGRVWSIVLPLSGYVAAAAAVIWGIVLPNGDNSAENLMAGLVVIGIGLVAACVSTVATASTKFTLIQSAQLLDPLTGPPDGAHSRTAGMVLIAVPAAAAVVGFSLSAGLLVRGDTPGFVAGHVMIGLSAICTALLALVWRRTFALANHIPLMPIGTALTCLFFAAFLFEAAGTNAAFFVPAHVLVGLGAVCFTLFSIASILEAGASE